MTTVRTKVFERMVRLLNVRGKLDAVAAASEDETRLTDLVKKQRRWDQADPPRSVKRKWNVHTLNVEGYSLHTLRRDDRNTKRTILYLHGGAYIFGPFRPEWAMLAKIADGVDCDFSNTQLIVGEGQQHTWPTAPTPEGRDAVDRIISLFDREQ